MIEVAARWWWLGERRRAMLAWAVFLAWEALIIPLALPKHMGSLGLADGFSLYGLGAGVFAAGVVMMLMGVIAMAVFAAKN